jgi:hypothetical protein
MESENEKCALAYRAFLMKCVSDYFEVVQIFRMQSFFFKGMSIISLSFHLVDGIPKCMRCFKEEEPKKVRDISFKKRR